MTMREITNEARERAMHEWMERIEKQMETLTTILHELRNEQRGIHLGGKRSDRGTPRLTNGRNNIEETAPMRA